MNDSSRALRILSVANVAEDPNSGVGGAEYQTIQALRELGHQVEAVWQQDIGRRISHGNLHYLLELPGRLAAIVGDRLERKPFDIVQISQPHGFRAARRVHASFPQTRFVHKSHGFESRVDEVVAKWRETSTADSRPPWRQIGSRAVTSLVARHNGTITRVADGHIVCSTQDSEFLSERFAVPGERIAVVPHAPPREFQMTDAPPMTADRLRHVLYVGQFTFVKAPHVAAAAMEETGKKRPDVTFTWVAAAEHHPAIRELFSPLMRPRVQMLGWMPQLSLIEVFDRCGVFLFPSYFEGTGKASIEALSRGLCVVASDVGGMHDMIEPDSGVRVQPGDPSLFSKAVLELLDDPHRARQMSEAAAVRAAQFTWRRTAMESADFFRRLLTLPRTS